MSISLTSFDSILHPGRIRQQALRQVKGLRLFNDYLGGLRYGKKWARVVLEPGDWMMVVADTDPPLDAAQALSVNRLLPGNLRFAIQGERLRLLAEARLDPPHQFAQAVRELRRGLTDACRQLRAGVERPAVEDAVGAMPEEMESAVQATIDRMGWDPASIVRHDQGWELRPKVGGQTAPIHLSAVKDGLRLHARLAPLAGRSLDEPLAHQALRQNARLRGARLSQWKDSLVAEARLDRVILSPLTLSHAALAVAVAKTSSAAALEALARDSDLKRWYGLLFLTERPPAPAS